MIVVSRVMTVMEAISGCSLDSGMTALVYPGSANALQAKFYRDCGL